MRICFLYFISKHIGNSNICNRIVTQPHFHFASDPLHAATNHKIASSGLSILANLLCVSHNNTCPHDKLQSNSVHKGALHNVPRYMAYNNI